jgi:MFS family permease
MITRRLVVCLGFSQLVCWGISYYLIGLFGEVIARDLGWSITLTYSGFSGALVVMGLTSGFIGRLVDRYGGRRVMTGGSVLLAIGCTGLAGSYNLWVYNVSWAVLGVGMRMTLYEAAFAALARIGGPSARRGIAQITLLGGLASTVFWPIGHALASVMGWRGAVLCYAVFALLTIPLHWAIPDDTHAASALPGRSEAPPPLAQTGPDRFLAATLYVLVMTLAAFLNSGMSAHMIGIMMGLGVGPGLAVWLSTLRGIGQSAARLCEVAFGSRLNPLTLGVIATATLPLGFILGLFSGVSVLAAALFALIYGAGNGLLTIVRGTQPLILFDYRSYGALSGWLTAPGFFFSALAPVAYASIIETAGNAAALYLSTAVAVLVLACALLLWWRFRKRAIC